MFEEEKVDDEVEVQPVVFYESDPFERGSPIRQDLLDVGASHSQVVEHAKVVNEEPTKPIDVTEMPLQRSLTEQFEKPIMELQQVQD